MISCIFFEDQAMFYLQELGCSVLKINIYVVEINKIKI